MTIASSFYSYLTGQIATVIYPQVLPASVTLPAITYAVQEDEDTQVLDGVGSLSIARIDVDCYATTLTAAETVATSVKSALIGFVGTFGADTAQNIAKLREIHLFETPTELHRVSMQFEIAYG